MTADAERSLDDVELEIARTRARLATTTDALAAELAPSVLAEKGVDMLNGLFARHDGIGLGGGLRADPVALAFIGLGLAWFIAENAGLFDSLIPERAEEPPPPVETASGWSANDAARADTATESGGWFHQVASATQGALHTVYDRGGMVIGQAGQLIAHPAASSERMRQAGGEMIGNVGRNPWLLGLVGIAVGAAIAVMLPTSRREREIAREARDEFWEKAEELGHRAADTVREIGGNAADAPQQRSTFVAPKG
jgi:hypothetical protein